MSRKFQRQIEDFTCENCGHQVEGSGYTNHCPVCLWSRHVDIQPGDREETCGGMMEPVNVAHKGGEYRILFRCKLCGQERWNKAAKEDDFEVLLQIAAEQKGYEDGF
jgi:hypothetical protein